MKQEQVEILLRQQNDALQQILKFMDEMNGLLARIEHRIDQLNPNQSTVSEDEARD